jgi:hypothetical protein
MTGRTNPNTSFFNLGLCSLCLMYPSFLICQNSVVTSVQQPTQIFFPFVAVAIYFWVGNSFNPCYCNSLLRKAGVSMSLAPYTDINITPPPPSFRLYSASHGCHLHHCCVRHFVLELTSESTGFEIFKTPTSHLIPV